MDINDVQLIGGPCGQHGPYTFFKAFKYTKNGATKILTLSEFFFVKMWRDSDLLCIGELQLLWIDKNSEQTLASLRLYFLPENTPEGRMDHGEDEVLAISEKVVIRAEDLITLITVEAEWTWGRLAKCEAEMKDVVIENEKCVAPRKPTGNSFSLSENGLDFSEVEQERQQLEPLEDDGEKPHVVILSFPKYCRYRAMMKRLEGVENLYLKYKIVNALGGFYVKHPNTRVLFCRDTFDYPELEGHELLCNHLAPKLKGRPRGKRKKRSVSPGSESNESESSMTNHYTRSADRANGSRSDSPVATRRSTRCHENNENKQFMKVLTAFMKSKHIPMGRIPSLGYKELNLHEFFTKVQKLGGYDCVTTNRLWKSIFDDMTGHLNSTSAATIIRRHYERFLLAYERHLKGEEYKPLPVSERRRLKSKRSSTASSTSDAESSNDTPPPSTSRTSSTPPTSNENKDATPQCKISSLRSIRVKPERQKDKQNSISDKSISYPGIAEPSVKVEPEDVKPIVNEEAIKSALDDVDIDNKLEIKSEIKDEGTKQESQDVKLEIKEDEESVSADPTRVTPSIPEGTKTDVSILDKNVEPLTSAVAPVAVTLIPDKILSPVEGKDNNNMPVIETGDTADVEVVPEVVNVPFKTQTADVKKENESRLSNSLIRDVKKIKLDILKEGGLEVTPVRSSLNSASVKEIRPSVIQPTLHLNNSKPSMPPPLVSNMLPKRINALSIPHSVNITQIKASTSTQKQSSFPFNGTIPPKVVQSKSIYSYSEKTVYGNPKDILQPVIPPQVVPRFVGSNVRPTGGDPMDLSITSPQKPVVEIMRIPQSSTSNTHAYYRDSKDSVTKNLYKSHSAPMLDGRKLGSNLEITLVGPKTTPKLPKPSSYVPKPPKYKRTTHEQYASKIARLKQEENGSRQNKYLTPQLFKGHAELTVSTPYPKNSTGVSTAKPDTRQTQPVQKPFIPPVPQPLPPYLPPFPTPEGSNGMPYLQLMDSMYYQAALQNVYTNIPMLPLPTPEQLKFYAELMAHTQHGRVNLPPFALSSAAGLQSPMNAKKP